MEEKGKKEEGSTSAPVTSMDRHASTRKAQREGDSKRKQAEEGGIVRVHLSRLWTDTQVQRGSTGGRNDGVAQLSKGGKILGKTGPWL